MIIKFIFNFSNFVLQSVFLIKLLTLGILFLAVVNPAFVAKLLISGILFSNSLSFVFFKKSVTSGILFSNFDLSVSCLVFKTNPLVSMLFTFATNLSYKVFLTTSFFTASLRLLKSTGTGTNFSMPKLST